MDASVGKAPCMRQQKISPFLFNRIDPTLPEFAGGYDNSPQSSTRLSRFNISRFQQGFNVQHRFHGGSGRGKRRRFQSKGGQRRFEMLEQRWVLDGTGLAGNECPPDLDLSAVAAQQATVGQTLTVNLLSAGGTAVDLNADGSETGDVLRFQLDPDIGTDTPMGATISSSGVFSWTPTAGQEGTYQIVVILVDEGTPPLADAETFTVTVGAAIVTPSVDLNGAEAGINFAATFTEGDDPVAAVDSDGLVVADGDSPNLQSATATLTSLPDGAAELLAVNTAGTSITAAYDDSTGVLTLSGADTLANYQQVLRTLTYDNTSEDPTVGDRLIEVLLNDGTNTSDVAESTISVVAVNDAPILDLNGDGEGIDFATTFTEGDDPVAVVDPGVAIEDTDGDRIFSFTATITNRADGEQEVLNLGESSLFTYENGVLTFSGELTLADYEQLIASLTYENTSDDPTEGERIIEIVVSDGTDDSQVAQSRVTVVAANDPPDLAPIADQQARDAEELVVVVTASDPDSGDTLTFDLDEDNSPAGATITQTGPTTAEVRWTPSTGDVGTNVGFRVLVTDDATPGEADSESFSVVVSEARPQVDLNGDDEGTGFLVSFFEGDLPVPLAEPDTTITTASSATIASATITITNLADGDAEVLQVDTSSLAGVTASYSAGVLSIVGEATVAEYQGLIAAITYENTSEDPTEGNRTIEIVVNDGGSDSLPVTSTVTVFSINDVPNLAFEDDLFDNNAVPTFEQGTQPLNFQTVVEDLDHEGVELVYQIDAEDSGLPEGATPPTVDQFGDAFPGLVRVDRSVAGIFTFRVLVTDAEGGVDQESFSLEITEAVPPTVVSAPTGIVDGPITSLSLVFSETLLESSLNPSNYSLAVLGGPNDGDPITITDVTHTDFTDVTLDLAQELPQGSYRLTLTADDIVDEAGNSLAGATTFDFAVDTVDEAFASL